MDKLETGELMQMQLMFLGGLVGSLAEAKVSFLGLNTRLGVLPNLLYGLNKSLADAKFPF